MGKLIVDKIDRQIYCVSTPLVNVSNINNSSPAATKNCISTSPTFNVGGFTISQANGITVPVPGLYMICYNCYMSSSVERASVIVTALIQGIPQHFAVHGYIRSHDDHNNSSVGNTQIQYLQAGMTVNLAFQQNAALGTVALVGANSHLALAKID